MKDEAASLSATVHGLVQGVGFLDFVCGHARGLGLAGYVRNRPDSLAVEVEAEGPRPKLVEFLELLHTGPPAARVRRVEHRWVQPSRVFSGFSIRS